MIKNNIYCKASGMVMQCIVDFQKETNRLPVVCEIGCADGFGTARYAGFCEFVIAIDPMISGRPDVPWSDDPESTSKNRQVFYKYWAKDQAKIDLFRKNMSAHKNYILVEGCSYWDDVIPHIKTLAEEHGGIDILLIDGCHHPFETVFLDFRLYQSTVNENGFIIFDDVYEDDIIRVVKIAEEMYNLERHEHWRCENPKELQEIIVCRKKKSV